MHEASITGLPAMRPLMLEYPDDPNTYGIDDEYLFGSDLLLAPVLREGATDARVLPAEGRAGSRSPRGARSTAGAATACPSRSPRFRCSCAQARSSSGSRSCSTPGRCRDNR